MNEKIRKKGDEGFSLIELVVAVAILAILSALGLVSYSKLIDNARQSAVDGAAASALNGVISYEADYDETTTAQGAVDEWNESAGSDSPITVELVELSNGGFRVIAKHEKGEEKVREWSADGSNGNGTLPPAEPEIPDPNPPVDETTPPATDNGSGRFTCDSVPSLPKHTIVGAAEYNHYTMLRINSMAYNGFPTGTTIRAYSGIDGSLVYENSDVAETGGLDINLSKLAADSNEAVFCDMRVEMEIDGEIVALTSEVRQIIPSSRKGKPEYIYNYRGLIHNEDNSLVLGG